MELFWQALWLFLIYSFLGWFGETIFAAIRKKRFSNRGIINGPFCIIYGIGALSITAVTGELSGIWLFLASAVLASLVEWIGGHLIEQMYHERWWDYSALPANLDGYISLPTAALWGVLGLLMCRWGNPLFLGIYHLLPGIILHIAILGLVVLLLIDGAATVIVLTERSRHPERWQETDAWLDSVSRKLGDKIYRFVNRRITKAYPQKKTIKAQEKNPAVFAYGCNFYKIVMLFFIGAFLGDITETIFCRITAGVWMSRSSVVWGPFSIVWGLAISAVTALLYKYRDRSDSFLFLMGTFLGGMYEYVCSLFTEVFFGTVFWDYSEIPFNLGGRINLLYCFFWGIAAVVWFKKLYPPISKLIERFPIRIGKIATWVLLVFMVVNVFVSCAALVRYDLRAEGVPASNGLECWIDEKFDDTRMERIYPNAIQVEQED